MNGPRVDVAETVYRFANGRVQRDWGGYRSAFSVWWRSRNTAIMELARTNGATT